ncbi:MAG: hypothetical protein V8Q59_06425 [Bifidobacterium animalis]
MSSRIWPISEAPWESNVTSDNSENGRFAICSRSIRLSCSRGSMAEKSTASSRLTVRLAACSLFETPVGRNPCD